MPADRLASQKFTCFRSVQEKELQRQEWKNKIPKKIKSERGAKIADLEKELKREYFQSLVGEELQLLVEKVNDDGTVTGTSCRYATVNAIAPNAAENELITVKIETAGDVLSGQAI